MKTFLFILSMSLLLHISFGASISRRHKRDVDDTKNSLELIKEFINKLGPLIKTAIEDIPSTNAYAKYKQEWEQFAKFYDDNSNSKQVCVDKAFKILSEFLGLLHTYEQGSNSSPEMEEVRNVFQSHGLNDLCAKYNIAVENAKDPSTNELLEEC